MMMTPPTYVHQVIGLNLNYLLLEALERKGLELLVVNDGGVRMRSMPDYLPRPDVVVVPGIAEYRSYAERFLLVAEVLSPSNTKSLIARKLRFYKSHVHNLYCLSSIVDGHGLKFTLAPMTGSQFLSKVLRMLSNCRNSDCAAPLAISIAALRLIQQSSPERSASAALTG